MILPAQFRAVESGDLAKFIIHICDASAMVSDCDERRFVDRILDVFDLFDQLLISGVVNRFCLDRSQG